MKWKKQIQANKYPLGKSNGHTEVVYVEMCPIEELYRTHSRSLKRKMSVRRALSDTIEIFEKENVR